jgi:hypothetical protein
MAKGAGEAHKMGSQERKRKEGVGNTVSANKVQWEQLYEGTKTVAYQYTLRRPYKFREIIHKRKNYFKVYMCRNATIKYGLHLNENVATFEKKGIPPVRNGHEGLKKF